MSDQAITSLAVLEQSGALTPAERFWRRTEWRDGCLEWVGARDKDGYGLVHFDGKLRRATRVSWMIAHGAYPDGHLVCHSCDNPSCVLPSHLFVGSASDNMRDAMRKGRKPTAGSSRICSRGHRVEGQNAITTASGQTRCRECFNEYQRSRRRRADVPVRVSSCLDCGCERVLRDTRPERDLGICRTCSGIRRRRT